MFRSTLAVVVLAAILVAGAPPPVAFAAGPCDAVVGAPDPDPPPIDPFIGGTILAGGATTEVRGATVRLFMCDGGEATEVDSTTTNASGGYAFTGFQAGAFYYVEADVSGPLSGMTVAPGSANPTAVQGVGGSAGSVDIAFK